jgi:hypothetical protein
MYNRQYTVPPLGNYPVAGRLRRREQGIAMLTVELESAERIPDAKGTHAIWRDMVDWLDAEIGRAGKLAATDDPPAALD